MGALLTTMTACVLASIQIREDVTSNNTIINCTQLNISYNASDFQRELPDPTAEGYFKAFGSIMFAFGGASTFPTIQVGLDVNYVLFVFWARKFKLCLTRK